MSDFGTAMATAEVETMTTQEFIESVEHYCAGLTVAVGCLGPECEYADGDDDHQCETHFSWSQCDSCGSGLGGDRFTAYGLSNDEPIKLSICVDCAMYHANGELPANYDNTAQNEVTR